MATARRSIPPVPAFARLFEDAATRLPGGDNRRVLDARRATFDRFAVAGFPTRKVETWKYSDVASVANQPMHLAPRMQLPLSQLQAWFAGTPATRRLIFVNGHVSPELSHVASLPSGLRVMSLARAAQDEPESVAAELAHADDERSLTALNAAFAGGGAWIDVAPGLVVEEPLQLIFVTVGQTSAVMTHPRNTVRVGAGAKLKLIETHVALEQGHCLTNLVGSYTLGEGAVLEHDRLLIGRDGTSFVGKTFLDLAGSTRLQQSLATLGGGFVRHETEAHLRGSGIECLLNGLYAPRGKEHVDNMIRVHHEAPGCHSNQFYKGVIDDESHAVFAGKIFVHQPAQKTDAFQKNDNLLLSDDAELDTKPELEIYADDVKCSHGATCGDLDPMGLFYLRSRGMDAASARSLLTFAFAAEVLERFADPTAKLQARHAVAARLPGGASLAEIDS